LCSHSDFRFRNKYSKNKENNVKLQLQKAEVFDNHLVYKEKLKNLAAEFELEELMCIPLVPTIERRKNIIEILAKELMENEEKN